MTNIEKTQDESSPRISRGKVDSLILYEVTESELDTLEKGSPISTYLNFSIFLLSIAIAFLISLLTVEKYSNEVFIVFTVICALGFIIGIFLLILWYKNRESYSKVITRIKQRLKSD